METEQIQEHTEWEWRSVQKERERERRRLRDRQRRQSMNIEERAKHLARRRRNYQLRRQRAKMAKLGIQQQVNFITQTAAEPNIGNDNQEHVFVSESSAQPDYAVEFATTDVNQVQNASVLKHHGETSFPGSYKYPQILRLTQIKRLARLLNSSSDKSSVGSQEIGFGGDTSNGEMAAQKGIPRKGIRLVHIKHLIRMLNSKMETTSEPNDSDKKKQGEEDNIEEGNDRELWYEKTIAAIDENEQICADGMGSLCLS